EGHGSRGFVLIILRDYILSLSPAGSHSLRYFYTGTNGLPGLPEFVIVGYVDEVQIMQYDSESRRAVSRQRWMDEITQEDPQYWERNRQIAQATQPIFKVGVQIALQRFNQTSGGVHTLQEMYGCELRDDGTTGGFEQFAYDGQDFIAFDKETQTWIAAVQQAVITKHKWEADQAFNHGLKGYLEQECIEWLKKYMRYGKEMLERKVRPEVRIYDRPGSEKNSIALTCIVTGFHPRAIDVAWIRDGDTRMDNAHTDGILPNEDGTYQIKKTIEIGSDDKHMYACEVEHSSLEQKL
uniref:Ig-like domain-containing protein n=1 Tax=Latimeria chalumnae TaxID=7897 RepID=H3AWB8_LATCH